MDYLKSPWDSEELECRVDRLIEKRRKLFSFPWGDFTLREGRLHCTTAKLRLSVQERIILKKLILNRNQPVSRDVLYYAMWGKPYTKKSRVVDMHISSIRRKLYSHLPQSKACITSLKGIGYLIA
jgi:DNA-binding response OmpR family regulator